ncbi:MAG: glycosyltransferase family 4 protein [Hyphomicrobiaceae bacterium]|nr:glycosyltransferase family 4 protein [Hyphomicrobiaceae bacterium]
MTGNVTPAPPAGHAFEAGGASATGEVAAPPFVGKVLIAVTEDWFALSHFKPLIRRLKQLAREVVVVTRSSGRMGEIAALGAHTIDLEYNRSSMNPVREAHTVRRLSAILAAERPDVVHLIAMKPIVLGGLATAFRRPAHTVIHMTGLGFLAISDTAKARAARAAALAVMRGIVKRPGSWLLVENPEDLAFLEAGGVRAGKRVTMLGGAGIDPERFPARPDPGHAVPVAAYVARMIRPKGVDVLMAAADMLASRGVPLRVELHGDTDDGNPEAISSDVICAWAQGEGRLYMGFTRDVASVWRSADIFVLPARSREGMPRALLEAAASGRPSIVSDVPGCRHFVTHGVEGLIVPPGDATALADAMETLARDPGLRARLGAAARAKVLGGYTEAHVEAAVEGAYRNFCGCPS